MTTINTSSDVDKIRSHFEIKTLPPIKDRPTFSTLYGLKNYLNGNAARVTTLEAEHMDI